MDSSSKNSHMYIPLHALILCLLAPDDRVPGPGPRLAAHVVGSLELGPVHGEVAPVRGGDVALAGDEPVTRVHLCAVDL